MVYFLMGHFCSTLSTQESVKTKRLTGCLMDWVIIPRPVKALPPITQWRQHPLQWCHWPGRVPSACCSLPFLWCATAFAPLACILGACGCLPSTKSAAMLVALATQHNNGSKVMTSNTCFTHQGESHPHPIQSGCQCHCFPLATTRENRHVFQQWCISLTTMTSGRDIHQSHQWWHFPSPRQPVGGMTATFFDGGLFPSPCQPVGGTNPASINNGGGCVFPLQGVYNAFSKSLDAIGMVIGSLTQFVLGNDANHRGSHDWPFDACPNGCLHWWHCPATTFLVRIPFSLPPSLSQNVGGNLRLGRLLCADFCTGGVAGLPAGMAFLVLQLPGHLPGSCCPCPSALVLLPLHPMVPSKANPALPCCHRNPVLETAHLA